MSEQKKAILYVDTSDEITSVIAKLQDTSTPIVAVVLPKRAPAFQSVINIKLLKKASEKAKKKTVLITSDKTILPLAGSAGVHVARTTESKPYIPDAPTSGPSEKTSTDDSVDPSAPVGELAEKAKTERDTIDLGDLPDLDLEDDGSAKKKKRKPIVKVPNFNKFRLWLILGGVGLILLVVGWYLAVFVLPRAEIIVETSSQNIAETIEFDAVIGLDDIDEEGFIIPATEKTFDFSDEATVETTGEINVGDRATGSVTITNCEPEQITINAGTSLIASNGRVFTSDDSVTIDPSNRLPPFRPQDCVEDESESVDVTASDVGTNYNISSTNYTIDGFSSNTVFGSGSNMSGGTDELVSAVDERDIRNARSQLVQSASPEAETELVRLHEEDGLLPITESLDEGDTTISSSDDEGDRANEVTVELETSFSMLGVEREDIRRLIEQQIGDEFDLERQAILDDGLDQASLRIVSTDGDTTTLRLRTIIAIGPDIDVPELTEEVAGLRRSETESAIFLRDGVRDVQIDYSPFWVFSTPNNLEKVTITVIQQGGEEAEFDEPAQDDLAEPEETDLL